MINYDDIRRATENIVDGWEENGWAVVRSAYEEYKKVSMQDFLSHCTACGENWCGMFLSGMKALYPKTYEAIPENMGALAFTLICDTLLLCGVDTSE